ncbi:MAG: PAS domain-containing protein [Chlamydiia bacterium]|nr:PAS domain-containing protein [Chlamydiia bacterium]
MLSFRAKIFYSYLTIFIVFSAFLYPIVSRLIENTQEKDLLRQAKELVAKLDTASSITAMLSRLKGLEKYLFVRVTLLDPVKGRLYDTHARIEDGQESKETILDEVEVKEAEKKGSGYNVRFSPSFGQDMAYMAVAFPFQNRKLILRAAFPYGQIRDISNDFTMNFLIFSLIVLLLFSLTAFVIIHYFSRPIKQIIAAISPYQKGRTDKVPTVVLSGGIARKDEFGRLASTLNSLSLKIEKQIAHLIEERNDKEALLESLGEGVIAIDKSGVVIFVNHVAEEMLNIDRDQVTGKSFENIKQPSCLDLLQSAQLNKMPITTVISPQGKRKRYFDASAVPRKETEGALLVLQDKTSLHKVLELGRDFIANASHELKTPITIIRGFAETLHDHPELSREVSTEITEKIVTNCERMETLVKNLLTLAAIDEGLPRSRMQKTDLEDIVIQCRQTVLVVHPDADIRVEKLSETPVEHLIDSDLFYQAILNLLDNSVKYSSPPAHVVVSLEKKKKEVVIKVKDQGLGIPAEDLERIFERFYSVDKSHSRSLGGSGLGLSIVARIIEKHRGKISAESELGRGTTFTITLPLLKRL